MWRQLITFVFFLLLYGIHYGIRIRIPIRQHFFFPNDVTIATKWKLQGNTSLKSPRLNGAHFTKIELQVWNPIYWIVLLVEEIEPRFSRISLMWKWSVGQVNKILRILTLSHFSTMQCSAIRSIYLTDFLFHVGIKFVLK